MVKLIMRDMVFVNDLQRRIGRPLTENELSSDAEFEVRLLSGQKMWVKLEILLFPYDLITQESDLSELMKDIHQEHAWLLPYAA
jgi:hypothetical protein